MPTWLSSARLENVAQAYELHSPQVYRPLVGGTEYHSELEITLRDHYHKYVMNRVRYSELNGYKYREFPIEIMSIDTINKLRELKYQVVVGSIHNSITDKCVRVVFWKNINNQGFKRNRSNQIRTKNMVSKFIKNITFR